MFCPKCGSEYREGFYRCADCEIDLVKDTPPPPPKPIPIEFEEILSTENRGDIALIKSVLEEEEITYHVQGENFNAIYPGQAAKLLVDKKQVKKAKDAIETLNLKYIRFPKGRE